MKKLIFSLAAASLLGTQISAQVIVSAPQAPESPSVDVRIAQVANVKSTGTVSIDRTVTYDNKTQDQDAGDGPKRTKNFTKSFALDNTDKISLSNQYGAITIKTWDKKEIKADVTMEAFSDTEKDAQKLIDEINLEAGKSGDLVSIKTVLNLNGNYGKRVKNGKVTWHREVKINFTIYMPATNALTASMQYGNVTMDNFSAPTSLKIQYGNLVAGNLSNSNNYINVQYGKINVQEVNKATVKYQYGGGLTIGTAGTVDLNVQYAAATVNTIKGNATVNIQYGDGLSIGSVDNIDLDAQYANVKLTTVNGNATVDQQYNNLTIGSVQKLQLNTAYTTVNVGTLKGDGNFKMEYNKLSINDITSGCKNLTVKASYVNIGLGFGSGYNASFDLKTEYSGFKYGSNVTSRKVSDDDDDSTKNYTGKIGNGGAAIVKVSAEYGSVNFK